MKFSGYCIRMSVLIFFGLVCFSANAALIKPEKNSVVSPDGFEVSWDPSNHRSWVRVYDTVTNEIIYDSGNIAAEVNSHFATLTSETDNIEIVYYELVKTKWQSTKQTHSVGMPVDPGPGPAPVDNLRAEVYSSTSAEILWDRSTGGTFVSYYEVVINGDMPLALDALSLYRNDWIPGENYEVTVVAVDATGKRSSPSSVSFVGGVRDPEPETDTPLPPANLRVAVYSDTAAEILWDRATDSILVTGYEIEINGEIEGIFDAISFYSTDWIPGTTYDISVVAINVNGKRSAPSTVSFVGGDRDPQPEPSQINLDNYVELLGISAELMLKTFGPDFSALEGSEPFFELVNRAIVTDSESGMIEAFVDCGGGNSIQLNGFSDGGGNEIYDVIFDNCFFDGDMINGTASSQSSAGGRESNDTYNLQFSDVQRDGLTANIVLIGNVVRTGDSEFSQDYSIEHYSRFDISGEISAAGSGNFYTSEEGSGFDSNLDIRVITPSTPLGADFVFTAEKIRLDLGDSDPDGKSQPVTGSFNLIAIDGSRLSAIASDTPGILNIIVNTNTGEYIDTLIWNDLGLN